MLQRLIVIPAALIALSGCTQVDQEALAQWCHNTVAARTGGTPEARDQAAPAVLACVQDPDNQRKFSRTWRISEKKEQQ